MASALIELLKDSSRRDQFAQAGRQRVEQAFSVEQLVAGTANVYEERLEEKGPYQPIRSRTLVMRAT